MVAPNVRSESEVRGWVFGTLREDPDEAAGLINNEEVSNKAI